MYLWASLVFPFRFSSNDLMNAILRSLAPADFQFGIIMGYFFGKHLVTGNKKYRTLSLWVPVLIHTCCNTLVQVPYGRCV